MLQDSDNGLQLRAAGETLFKNECLGDFPGSAVDKNPPANAKDMDLISVPGRFYMLWSN